VAVTEAVRRIRLKLSDVAFGQLCAELESLDRERSGMVEWRSFGRALSRLMPSQPVRTRRDVARVLAAAGMRLRPGRQVDYLGFFDSVAPTAEEAARVASGAADMEEVAASGVAVDRALRAEQALAELDRGSSLEGVMAADGEGGSSVRGGVPLAEGAVATMDDVARLAGPGPASFTAAGGPVERAAALRAREESVRRRLRLVSDRPMAVTAGDVVRLMRDRAMRSSALRAFRSMDADGNGVLDAGEVRSALRRLRLDLPRAEADALIRAIDVNGDGVVQWDEWAAFVADRQREEVAGRAVRGEGGVSKHNAPPPGAASKGNRRGLVRAAEGTAALQAVADHHAAVVRRASCRPGPPHAAQGPCMPPRAPACPCMPWCAHPPDSHGTLPPPARLT